MRRLFASVVGFLMLISPASAGAQDGGPVLLPPGGVRVGVAGIYTEAPREGFDWDLTDAFVPLYGLDGWLADFMENTGGVPPEIAEPGLTAGELILGVRRDALRAPISLSVGVLPKFELGVVVPIVRGDVSFDQYLLADGTVGINPDLTYNSGILAGLSDAGEVLGSWILLPTEESAAGQALQSRVVALTEGDSLRLPAGSLGFDDLQGLLGEEFGLMPLAGMTSPWAPGDVEINGRFEFLDTSPDAVYPSEPGNFEYRGIVSAGIRLPTGSTADPRFLFAPAPEGGLAGYSVGIRNDLFYGDRLWVTFGARYNGLSTVEVERRLVEPDRPFAYTDMIHEVRWTPGNTIAVDVQPSYRLTEAISLGVRYAFNRRGASEYEVSASDQIPQDLFGPGILNSPAITSQQIGGGVRYSTVGAGIDDEWLPFEIGLDYLTGIGDCRPVEGLMVVELNLFHRLWGGN